MTTKNRIRQLEKLKIVKREPTVYKFTQEVRADGSKFFFIDDVQVDAARYEEELSEYKRLNTNSKIPNELIIFSNGMDSKESISIFVVDGIKFEKEN